MIEMTSSSTETFMQAARDDDGDDSHHSSPMGRIVQVSINTAPVKRKA
jgi:hypothetical protein